MSIFNNPSKHLFFTNSLEKYSIYKASRQMILS